MTRQGSSRTEARPGVSGYGGTPAPSDSRPWWTIETSQVGPLDCIICDHEVSLSSYGVVAPFIAELTQSPAMSPVTLQHCEACQFSFFSHRYSDTELAAIYGGYRGSDYLRVRKRWEPWYGSAVNGAYQVGSEEVRSRTAFMDELIAKATDGKFNVAVDFGGDEGQFFPDSAVGRKIVIDVSGKPMLAGVELYEDLKSLGTSPDLVMICHVLEHLNDPVALLREVCKVIDAQGVLYVEVPMDMPRLHGWHARAAYQKYLVGVGRTRWPLVASDFLSGVSRQVGFRIPRLGVVKQSEHINYFTDRSLKALLSKAGFNVIAHVAEPTATVGGLRLGKLGMVAVPADRA
jgi:Methyltransferase domain